MFDNLFPCIQEYCNLSPGRELSEQGLYTRKLSFREFETCSNLGASLMAKMGNLPEMWETWVQSLD